MTSGSRHIGSSNYASRSGLHGECNPLDGAYGLAVAARDQHPFFKKQGLYEWVFRESRMLAVNSQAHGLFSVFPAVKRERVEPWN